MKKSLFALIALVGCHFEPMHSPPGSWEHAANGSCYPVQVNLPADQPARCPNRDHFAPSEVDRSKDGRYVAYICVCAN